MCLCYTFTQMIEVHFAKSNAAVWLPKPRVKGADAEVGVVAYTLLATQITSVLLSQKCGALFILIGYVLY